MRAVLAALVLVLSLAPASHAEPSPDAQVPPAAEAGVHDEGWLKVKCAGTTSHQRCVIRVPRGFRSMDTTYLHAGQPLATETTMPYPPHTVGTRPRFTARITSGIKVSCRSVEGRVTCEVRASRLIDRFAVTTISAGTDYGGIVWVRS